MAPRTTTSQTSSINGDSTSSSSGSGTSIPSIGGSSGSSSSSSSSSSMNSLEIAFIVYLVFFVGYFAAHLWRYNQTKARTHLLMSSAIFVGILSFALLITGYEIRNLYLAYVGLMLIVVCLWMLRFIVAFLLVAWSRSMTKVFNKSRMSFRFGAITLGGYGVASILTIVGYILVIVAINSYTSSPSISISRSLSYANSIETAFSLTRAGYGIQIGIDIVLTLYCFWLLMQTPNNGTPGLAIKRRQMLLLAVLFTTLTIADIGSIAGSLYVEVIFTLIFLALGLYPKLALTGFESEPDLTAGAPIINPGVVYVQQPVVGQPGVVYSQPTVVGQPAVMTPQPGVVYGQPGVVYNNQPGVAYSQPGVAYSQPGVPYSQPGVPYSQPGVPYSQSGVPYSQPGVAYPPPGNVQYREDPSKSEPPAPVAGVVHTGMPEPVVTHSAMESVPISSAPAAPGAPYPQT